MRILFILLVLFSSCAETKNEEFDVSEIPHKEQPETLFDL